MGGGFTGMDLNTQAPQLVATYPVDGSVSEYGKVTKKDALQGKDIPPGCAVAIAYPNPHAGCKTPTDPIDLTFQFIPPIFIHPSAASGAGEIGGNNLESSKDKKQDKADEVAIVNMKLVFSSTMNSRALMCSDTAKPILRAKPSGVVPTAAAACPNASNGVDNAACGNVLFSTQYL
jgi:hypothetical protein